MKIDRHHKFARHKNRIIKYGDLINHPSNIQEIEHNEHLAGKGEKQSEREFCINAGIAKCEYCGNYYKECFYKINSCAARCKRFNFNLDKYNRLELNCKTEQKVEDLLK